MSDISKSVSTLSFIGCSLSAVKGENNILTIGTDTTRSIDLYPEIVDILYKNNEILGTLDLTVSVNIQTKAPNTAKCLISVTLRGFFRSSGMDRKQFCEMVAINGGSTLYSFARTYIMNISAAMLAKDKIILPMINMVKFIETNGYKMPPEKPETEKAGSVPSPVPAPSSEQKPRKRSPGRPKKTGK